MAEHHKRTKEQVIAVLGDDLLYKLLAKGKADAEAQIDAADWIKRQALQIHEMKETARSMRDLVANVAETGYSFTDEDIAAIDANVKAAF
jgi:hypothetical protein